jgi:hypothetical protein
VVGPATWRALAVPAAARARRIAANLERYRWLPHGAAGTALVVDEGAGTAELRVGPERRFFGSARAGAPCPAGGPMMADTVRALQNDGGGMTLMLAGGSAVRLGPVTHPAGTCVLVDEYDGLGPLLASAAAEPVVLFLLAPTAVAAAAGHTTFRADTSGADERLEAALGPILSRTVPPACAERPSRGPPGPPPAAGSAADSALRRPAPARGGTGSAR